MGFHLGLLLAAIEKPLQMPMPGGIILGGVGGLGLGSYQCFCIKARDTESKKDM